MRSEAHTEEGKDTPKVVFLHDKLINRQIDRYILCLGLVLLNLGFFRVAIWTTQFNEEWCIEVTDAKYLIQVKTFGRWIPSSIFGYFKSIMSYFRALYLALKFIFVIRIKTSPELRPKAVFHDSNSIVSVLLKLFTSCKVFYIRDSLPYNGLMLPYCYNAPTALEAFTINWPDRIIVQCFNFATRIQLHCYPIRWAPKVLYEAVDIGLFRETHGAPLERMHLNLNPKPYILLSVGKYNIINDFKLAVDSFHEFLELIRGEMDLSRFRLIIASYTYLREENVYFKELQRYVYKKFENPNCVILKRILPAAFQKSLLKVTKITIHPSTRDASSEFLLKSMYMGKIIVGTNTGLASKLLSNRVTGILTKPKPKDFARVYREVVQFPHLLRFLQASVKDLFMEKYSFTALTRKTKQMLEDHLIEVPPLEMD